MKDKVREVNGTEVFTPEDMMNLLKEARDTVTMKVVQANSTFMTREQVGIHTLSIEYTMIISLIQRTIVFDIESSASK